MARTHIVQCKTEIDDARFLLLSRSRDRIGTCHRGGNHGRCGIGAMVMDVIVDHPGISETLNDETAYWPCYISGNYRVARSMYGSSCLTAGLWASSV